MSMITRIAVAVRIRIGPPIRTYLNRSDPLALAEASTAAPPETGPNPTPPGTPLSALACAPLGCAVGLAREVCEGVGVAITIGVTSNFQPRIGVPGVKVIG